MLLDEFLVPFFSNYFPFASPWQLVKKMRKEGSQRGKERNVAFVIEGVMTTLSGAQPSTLPFALPCVYLYIYIYTRSEKREREGRIRWCALLHSSVFLLFLFAWLVFFFVRYLNVCTSTTSNPFVDVFPFDCSMVARTGNSSTMSTSTPSTMPATNYFSSNLKMNLPQNLRTSPARTHADIDTCCLLLI